ncbi:DUF423 domain-containing protein [Floridanema evergladense]|uniref:DUF423 domain-containing protein n=1 Tax=Floridaenema evergladense BLCC-F167 TaxID=3153639 RepID=A0ABV4WNQ8_9CYAN
MMQIFLIFGAIFGAMSVGAGAFASHALKEKLTERAIAIFEVGAHYQMYHALALLFVGLLFAQFEKPTPVLLISGWAFVAGVIIFSGSLYALSLTGIKWLGAITPLGGAAFIVGWSCLAIAAWALK